jgi:hypothetical protein
MTTPTKCCIPGCSRGNADHAGPEEWDGFCAEHLLLASAASRALLRSARTRLERLERSWDEDEIFEAIAARGRYLRFCALIEAVHDHVDRAWERVKSEILGTMCDFEPGWHSIVPSAGERLDSRTPAGKRSMYQRA